MKIKNNGKMTDARLTEIKNQQKGMDTKRVKADNQVEMVQWRCPLRDGRKPAILRMFSNENVYSKSIPCTDLHGTSNNAGSSADCRTAAARLLYGWE
ncbi:MAG: hypothetical protein ABR955_11605 [Verrucomicrobiota bacterium]